MPIKEQCNNCRYHIDNNCTQLVTPFDGTSCDVYVKRINLYKTENESESLSITQQVTSGDNQDITSEFIDDDIEAPSDEDIHGWLKFFLIVFVGIGSVASVVLNFATFESGDNFWMSSSDVVFSLVYLATGISTIVAFHKRDTDAVFLAKTFVVLYFASNLLGLFTMDGENNSTKVVTSMIRSIIWCCIWFIFLCNSNQVERLIPVTYRKTKTRDWIIIATVILLPLACIGLGIASEKKSRTEVETAALTNLTPSPNQYSDGRIVITLPNGVDCKESIAENTKVFSISDPKTGAEVTVVSDYNNEITKQNFNQYWHSWKSDELNGLEYDVVKDDKQSNDNITVFYKLIRIKLDDPVDWEFALVFDHQSGKFCLVSGYSNSNGNSPVGYIINNLRFL